MKIEYASTKVEAQCTSLKEARKLFGGDNGEPFVPCNIDEIASSVKIVEISEVSKHYE